MITTITLNTSIDKAYFMENKIENGTVMRVGRVHNTAGGKGLNVARIVRLCGSEVLAGGFVGGFNGSYLTALLKEAARREAASIFWIPVTVPRNIWSPDLKSVRKSGRNSKKKVFRHASAKATSSRCPEACRKALEKMPMPS